MSDKREYMDYIKNTNFETSALTFPIKELIDLIQPFRVLHTKDGSEGMIPHFTAHYPFVKSNIEFLKYENELRTLCSKIKPFEIEIKSIERFEDNGVLYFKPESDIDISEIMKRFAYTFKTMLPYDGKIKIEDLKPHITIATLNIEKFDQIEKEINQRIKDYIPMSLNINELWLVVKHDNKWLKYKSYNIGNS